MILVDSETKVDLLNNEAIAKTIVLMMRERPDKPVTIGVHGDWGAGKSSVLEMIETELEGEDKILCIKFNGWRFQGFEDAKIALIEGVLTSLATKRTLSAKAKRGIVGLLKRVDYMKLAKRGGGLAINVATGMPSPDQIQTAVTELGHMASDPAEYVNKDKIEATAKSLGGILKPAKAKRMPQEVEEFRKDFGKLLKETKVDQLVVLIDDLDRCLPPTVIETLEAVRLFVFTENTAFIVGADEAMIEYAVRRHFPELPGVGAGSQDYARNYLEKLIQVPFRIPALGETETRIYVALLLIGAVVGEEDAGFKKLVEEARDRLKRPWLSHPLDVQAVTSAIVNRADVQEMLTLSDQIGPILAAGTRGNPRQIKRFLNALLLRKNIAEARGFGGEVELPKLGKLMLVERFIPQYFPEIADGVAASHNGVSKDIEQLESGVSGDNKIVEGWLESSLMKDWAALEPKLKDVDLRPYLFVSKDKKDYFGSSAVLGNLLNIVERLLGPKLAVSGMKSELTALAPPEAVQVFEELRSRIMGGGDLKKRPAGADGMVALAGVHPVLEGNLLDFLEALPTDRIGVWPTGGWPFKDQSNKARYGLLLTKWSNVTGNDTLKNAATAAAAVNRG